MSFINNVYDNNITFITVEHEIDYLAKETHEKKGCQEPFLFTSKWFIMKYYKTTFDKLIECPQYNCDYSLYISGNLTK